MDKGLQRFYAPYKHRSMSYYNPCTGGLWSELSKVHRLEPGASLEKVLDTCDTQVLYFLPDKRGRYPTVEQFRAVPGITIRRILDYKGDDKKRSGTLRYKGKYITFYSFSTWFDVSALEDMREHIRVHHDILPTLLQEHFQPKAVHHGTKEAFPIELLATPTQMGSDLLKRSLPYGKVYPSPCPGEAEILLHKLGQGRIETFHHGIDTLDNLQCYDGRWMYAACLRPLPVGTMVHDLVPDLAMTEPSKTGTRGVIPGFYRARVTVPDGWNHIGLLPMEQYHQGQKYSYPRTPGTTFETWTTSPELALALTHHWKVDILERIYYPDTFKEPEPLKLWKDRLILLRNVIAESYPEPVRSLIREAVRNILLHTVGSFRRYAREFDGYARWEDIPHEKELTDLRPVPGSGLWYYASKEPLSPLQKQLCLPQWADFIWGLARKKLAEAALTVPFEHIVMLRVDAIWANGHYHFPDERKPGQFVNKPLQRTSGLLWPKNNAQAVKTVQAARGTRDDVLKDVHREDEE